MFYLFLQKAHVPHDRLHTFYKKNPLKFFFVTILTIFQKNWPSWHGLFHPWIKKTHLELLFFYKASQVIIIMEKGIIVSSYIIWQLLIPQETPLALCYS